MLSLLATLVIVISLLSAAWIIWDIRVRRKRLKMPVMEVVWPVTALYLGPLAVLGYRRWRVPAETSPPERTMPVATTLAVSHCGAGCTLGDIIGSTLVFVVGLQLLGTALWPELAIDFVLAFSLGIVFQYLTIVPMRNLSRRDGLVAALKADTLSLVSFEVGLFAWMVLVQLVIFPQGLRPNEATFWFMMQIGMILGFLTAYPVNWWLVRRGIKERM